MEILFSNHFERSFKRLDQVVRLRILDAVKELREFPKAGKELHGRLSAYRSLRVGDYRVIYSIESNAVRLHDVGHRQSVYD